MNGTPIQSLPLLSDIRAKKLATLARQRFSKSLTETEQRILRESTVPSERVPSFEMPEKPGLVRPEFLHWLVGDEEAAPLLDQHGIVVLKAEIFGNLELQASRIAVPLHFLYCTFGGTVSLLDSSLRALYIEFSTLSNGFLGDRARIEGSISFRQSIARAEVRLLGAQIGGDLDCSGAMFASPENSLSLDGAVINGKVELNAGFRCEGTVRLLNAQVGRELDCSGATLDILNCENLQLSGRLIWTAIKNPHQAQLALIDANVKSLHDDKESWPAPENLLIDGFVYQDLVSHKSPASGHATNFVLESEEDFIVADRIEWLKLQPPERLADLQPWMQLSKIAEAKGDHTGSKRVIYEFKHLRAERAARGLRPLIFFYDWIEENPFHVLWPIGLLWLFGWLVFWRAARIRAMAPTDKEAYEKFTTSGKLPDQYQPFSPTIYALENIMPVVKLGQDNAWAPNPRRAAKSLSPKKKSLMSTFEQWAPNFNWLRWIRWLLILLGWVLALILASVLGSSFKQ